MVTLKDIAYLANVSISAVSRVLKNDEFVFTKEFEMQGSKEGYEMICEVILESKIQ